MKTDDKKSKTNMVSRNSDTASPFTAVQKHEPQQPSQVDAMLDEVSAEESEIEGILDGLRQRQSEVAQKKVQVAEAARKEKLEVRAALLDDAADWREIARTSPDANRAKDFMRKAKDAEAEAARIGVELNLVDAVQPEPAPVQQKPLSSSKALGIMVGLFLFFVALTCVFGEPLLNNPMNTIGYSMMKNAPIRALLSFTLTFLSVLVSVALVRIVFPQFYRIWHNRIDSERSLESLLSESPAWAVLLSLLALFFMFMQLFASFYQAMYA